MATPAYKGIAQAAPTGLLSGIGSWFGGQAPAYAGSGQPSGSTGFFGGSTPAYKTRTADTTPEVTVPCSDPDRITIVIPRELLEPQS